MLGKKEKYQCLTVGGIPLMINFMRTLAAFALFRKQFKIPENKTTTSPLGIESTSLDPNINKQNIF